MDTAKDALAYRRCGSAQPSHVLYILASSRSCGSSVLLGGRGPGSGATPGGRSRAAFAPNQPLNHCIEGGAKFASRHRFDTKKTTSHSFCNCNALKHLFWQHTPSSHTAVPAFLLPEWRRWRGSVARRFRRRSCLLASLSSGR